VTTEPLFGLGPQTIPLQVDPKTIQPSARVEAMGTSVIAFRDDGPWGDRSAGEVLTACVQYVSDRVIPSLRKYFE
jgi:hypothetical protein